MTRLSNWREESDLFEVVTGKMTDEKALKKVDDKKGIKNKVIINPKLTEAIKNIGGELISIKEQEEEETEDNTAADQKKKQVEQKQKRAQMIKKQVLMKKLIAVRQGAEDIVAHHEPEGEVIEGYAKPKGMEDLPKGSKVRVKKGAKVQGKYVKEASAVLDANKKLEKEKKTKKDKAELAKLTHIYKGMKKGIYNSYEPEGDLIDEAKVDQGRSDYGKASIRNYRRKGPGHGEPAMFDPENKRGKLIDKRREEHKARRGVKGAKVPAYKVEHHQKDKDGNTIPHENLNELNRYGKETGKATGSMNKRPGSPVKKGGSGDKALNVVRGMIRKQQGKPEGQQKKVKGVKSDAGTGKYLDKQKSKKAFADRAKKAGYKNPQDYANAVARYGSEDNMKKGRGLGT